MDVINMEVKNKRGSEMLDATIEMVDGVMVVSPKEKFEPKDGDVVTVTTEKGGSYTCFFKFYVGGDVHSYGGLNNLYNMLFKDALVCYREKLITIYPATEKEKKKLFDKLAEEGWEWRTDTKEFVKLKCKPKEGEYFYFPICSVLTCIFTTNGTMYNSGRDKSLLDNGWCFKTAEECDQFCRQLNNAINSVKP